MIRNVLRAAGLGMLCGWLTQCGPTSFGAGNLGGPTVEERNAKIAAEPTGDFFYGRRYYVEKTRFWGYVRKPRQPWSRARLVLMDESRKLVPDRLPENGPSGARYGHDNNFEYKLNGFFSGSEGYDPNSNQFLPIFTLTGYELLDRQPGWIFQPDDRYDPVRITLRPR